MNSLAVQKGAEWLDANAPGWRAKINKDTLNIRSWSQCVLGQVFGVANIKIAPELKEFGFFAHTDEENQMMIKLWKEVI